MDPDPPGLNRFKAEHVRVEDLGMRQDGRHDDAPRPLAPTPRPTPPTELPLLRQLLADLDSIVRAEDLPPTIANRLRVALGLDAWLLLASFRVRQALKRRRVPIVGRVIRMVEMSLFGAELSLHARIGTGFYVAHSHGVVVGGTTVVGDHVKILGSNTFGNRQGFGLDYPTVGSNVVIGAGARVLGDVTLGDGCRVGANAVVTCDVADGVTVVGIPARPV